MMDIQSLSRVAPTPATRNFLIFPWTKFTTSLRWHSPTDYGVCGRCVLNSSIIALYEGNHLGDGKKIYVAWIFKRLDKVP